MIQSARIACVFVLALVLMGGHAAAQPDDGVTTRTSHALSLFGEPKYPKDFPHFDYVNTDAPKGGIMRQSTQGSFDSFNPFVVKGVAPPLVQLIYDPLMTQSLDEPYTHYGLIAESVEVPNDFSWVTYTLRPEARWHDGTPITPEDVVFTFDFLVNDGKPEYRFYYGDVEKAEKVGERSVKFTFSTKGNKELPQVVGQLRPLPKHYWEGSDENGNQRDITRSFLVPPLGSGPLRVGDVDAGRRFVLERVPDYWAKDLNVNVGAFNFDYWVYEFYLDSTSVFEGFKKGEYDIRQEFASKRWATEYNFPAVERGDVIQRVFRETRVPRIQGAIMNLRRSKFSDRRVRRAFIEAFNFEWLNENFFYNLYTRTDSYFDETELAAEGLPSEGELALLEPYRDQLPPELFTESYTVPKIDGDDGVRRNLRKARALFNEAGWRVEDGVLTNETTGEKMEVEFLIASLNAGMERIFQAYARDLEKLGVILNIRIVDISQYQQRVNTFDFDMITQVFLQSLSPGNEQRDFWGSEAADREGSQNTSGIKDPVVDAIIEELVQASTREEVVAAVNALDRVLLWGHYMVPQWHSDAFYAYWDRFGFPEPTPAYSVGIPTIWWYKGAENDPLADRMKALESQLSGQAQ